MSYSARFSLLLAFGTASLSASPATLRFDFGSGQAERGYVAVPSARAFTLESGYGFEPPMAVREYAGALEDALRNDGVTATAPFHFTASVPAEGNYQVSVTLGHPDTISMTTIKAELRRLMIEEVSTRAGEFKTVTFVVNVRTPKIRAVGDIPDGVVKLKSPRETVQEAWAWDQAITLEFGNTRPAVCAVEIRPVDVPTIFLLGDSTVCDQSKEPYNSWGQMITRFFKPTVAIANHGESGETYRDSLARRRIDKIASLIRPGDWVLMQFGHNDQKQIAAKTGDPATTYRQELRLHVEKVRARGGKPVIVSPMERRGFDAHGKTVPSLRAYADAARLEAGNLDVPFIDLNALSIRLYEALGVERSAAAFAAPMGAIDNTHHNNYGSYQLAKCMVQAIRDLRLPIAQHIVDDFPRFEPARPDDPDQFKVPASAEFTNERPLGD